MCGLVHELARAGWRSAVIHHRGCSGEPNRLPRSYHAGDSGDIDAVVRLVREREPRTPLFAAGYSLGGSMLVHWLADNDDVLTAACTVSTPFDLAGCVARLERGASRIYQTYLVAEMKRLLQIKARSVPLPIDMRDLSGVRTFHELDDLVTAPLHGFKDADEYYARCSAGPRLQRIRTHLLLIQAADDPLMTTDSLPRESDLPAGGRVRLELSRRGGHCGFVCGGWPKRPRYWAAGRIVEHFRSFLS